MTLRNKGNTQLSIRLHLLLLDVLLLFHRFSCLKISLTVFLVCVCDILCRILFLDFLRSHLAGRKSDQKMQVLDKYEGKRKERPFIEVCWQTFYNLRERNLQNYDRTESLESVSFNLIKKSQSLKFSIVFDSYTSALRRTCYKESSNVWN